MISQRLYKKMAIIMVPSKKFIDFPLPAYGETYIAPDYGFINIYSSCSSMGLSINGPTDFNTGLNVTGDYITTSVAEQLWGNIILCPVKRDDIIYFYPFSLINIYLCRFIYAEGTSGSKSL